MKLLSEEILKIRRENKLTQQEFADRIFVTRQAVSKWERDKSFPSEDIIDKIKEEFNVDLSELVSEENVKTMTLNNTSEIKRIKKFNVVLFSGIAITVGILLSVLFFVWLLTPVKDIELELYEEMNYVAWDEDPNVKSWTVSIDGKRHYQLDADKTYFYWEDDEVEGDYGTKHTIQVTAISSKSIHRNKKSQVVEFEKVEKNLNNHISELNKNQYRLDKNGNVVLNFKTRLYGLFKINLYYNNSSIPFTDMENLEISTTNYSSGTRIHEIKSENNGWFLYIDRERVDDRNWFMADIDYEYRLRITHPEMARANLKIELELVQQAVYDATKSIRMNLNNVVTAYEIEYHKYVPTKRNSCDIIEVTFNEYVGNKTIKLNTSYSSYYNIVEGIYIYDEDENLLCYAIDTNELKLPPRLPQEGEYKLYIVIKQNANFLDEIIDIKIE